MRIYLLTVVLLGRVASRYFAPTGSRIIKYHSDGDTATPGAPSDVNDRSTRGVHQWLEKNSQGSVSQRRQSVSLPLVPSVPRISNKRLAVYGTRTVMEPIPATPPPPRQFRCVDHSAIRGLL